MDDMDEGILPVFQLTELVDELARDSDEDITDPDVSETRTALRSLGAGQPDAAPQVEVSDLPGVGPAGDRSAGERAASAFWRCCQTHGLTAFCDALTYSGLRDELPRLAEMGITVLAPTNEAFAQISEAARSEQRLVRQLLLGHICSGTSTLADVRAKNCAVAVAGQTHACYVDEGYTYVGTGRLARTDVAFDGGVLHEVTSCLMVLSLVRDSHSEQVWKKALQPSPVLAALGGVSSLGAEFEVHGCLLHAATGQLVPEALRGHVRGIKPVNEEQRLTFSEITVMAKPPSLAKRRGAGGAPDGSNRYRLLFSIWNTTSLSYISWQHMATPLVVRNSFHMLPIEEKNWRRQQYARARSGGSKQGGPSLSPDEMLPPLPEGETYASLSPSLPSCGNPLDESTALSEVNLPPLTATREYTREEKLKRLSMDSSGAAALLEEGEFHLQELQGKGDIKASPQLMGAAGNQSQLPGEWLPLSEAPRLPETQTVKLDGELAGRVRANEQHEQSDSESQASLSHGAHSLGGETRDSIGTEPLWVAMTMEPQEQLAQLQAMAQHRGNGASPAPPPISHTASAPAVLPGAASSAPIAFFGAGAAPPAPAPASAAGFQFALGGLAGGTGEVAKLVDCSCREGPCAGGTLVWLHGEHFSPGLSVHFGGVIVPQVQIVSKQMIKCISPPFSPIYPQPRHEVAIAIVGVTNGAPVGGTRLSFTYTYDPTTDVGHPAAIEHKASKELLRRLLASLERAQAAASGQAFGAFADAVNMGTELSLSAFNAMDEHGYSLAEYTTELKGALGIKDGTASGGATGASDLQAQHQEMANILKRERLSASLAKRPSLDALHMRNIFPDAERASLARSSLASSFASRPPIDALHARHILHADNEKAEQLRKKKRLEGFLAERPTLAQVQETLGASGKLLPPPSPNLSGPFASLATLDDTLDADTLDAALDGMPTLDADLGDDMLG